MKKFTSILEKNGKFFKVEANLELMIPAENEGEASYIADSTMSSIKNISEYIISNVDEVSKEYITENINLQENEEYQIYQINSIYESEIGSKKLTPVEKLELYHNLRKSGYSSNLIHKVLENKLLVN